MSSVGLRDDTLDRMVRAVEKVRERLLRAASALRRAGVDYAIAGGNAVAVWVAQIDEGAVRNTRDVDLLIRRADLDRARAALEPAGFHYLNLAGLDLFLDGVTGSPREAIHILFAGEMVRPEEPSANPDVTESQESKDFRVLTLEALIRIKLTAFRRKDQVHLLDMLELGLIDATWCARLSPILSDRLRLLIENPD